MMRPICRAVAALVLVTGAGFPYAAAQDKPPPGPQPPPGSAGPPPAAPAFTPPQIVGQRRAGASDMRANAAVAAGLDWLRRHQAKDGRWDTDAVGEAPCACAGPGQPTFDPGVTGLAVLAFLGAGRTHTDGSDATVVRTALDYLLCIQDSEGCFGPRTAGHFQYNHACATMAVAEALWLTGDEKLVGPVARARDFLLASQNPYLGWRYGVRYGDNDTSMTCYAVLALRTCQFAHLDVSDDAYAGAQSWLMKMTFGETGRVGYQSRGGDDARAWNLEARRAPPPVKVGPFVVSLATDSVHTGASRDDPTGLGRGGASVIPPEVLERFPQSRWSSLTAAAAAATVLTRGADAAKWVDFWGARIAERPPTLKDGGFLDLHYLLFGSLFHVQRPAAAPAWRPWRTAAVADLLATQRAKDADCAAGSWNPDLDPFGVVGGRVYSTAMAVLALQAPNRFPKVWDPKRKLPAPATPPKSK